MILVFAIWFGRLLGYACLLSCVCWLISGCECFTVFVNVEWVGLLLVECALWLCN